MPYRATTYRAGSPYLVDIPAKICPKWESLVKGLNRKWESLVKGLNRKWEKFSQTKE
jgi:hypothetical protein